MARVAFGWIAPVIGVAASGRVPLVVAQQAAVLPVVARHFDSLWLFDHFFGFDDPADPYLECWTTLTWLAARYPALTIGPLVLGVGYRNPALVAKMAATLHALRGGRVVLGLGAGWREAEYRAYGYPFPRPAVRVRQLEEAATIIRRMWTEPAPTFAGDHFSVARAYCAPAPTPAPPLLIAGEGERRLLPLVARRADWWNTYFVADAATYRRKRDLLYRHAEALGRDPATIVLTFSRPDSPLPRSADDSARWLEYLAPLVALGVRHFMLDFGHDTPVEAIERFAAEVIAPLRGDGG
jgi:alkanesulfonate monooxygenase SsuD/methylene tetrahydromethanopterin reductase-like flavin-dependent oxidoreductase (luciferase family)